MTIETLIAISVTVIAVIIVLALAFPSLSFSSFAGQPMKQRI
jgi:heme/copper-type cytochrome/quinol oxidase subunit 2